MPAIPELRAIRDRLLGAGAKPAAMTGSGSSLFGIFEDPALLTQARKLFFSENSFSISFVSRAQYRSAWRRALAPHIVLRNPQEDREFNGKEDLWPPQSLYA